MTYSHLGLKDWPFRIVPEPEFCDFLADRTALRQEVEALLTSLENRPTSDIQLVWSWYGAGKTHTLYYLANQCRLHHKLIFPVYTELPREADDFLSLYRVTISQFPPNAIIDAYLEYSTRPTTKPGFVRPLDPDLNSALTQAALGERPTHVLFNQWLLGNPLPVASLRELGVGGRINTTEKCAAILADVISLLAPRSTTVEPRAGGVRFESSGFRRVTWIVDEVQRVDDLSSSVQRSILSGLVGVFNKCPTGLTIVLSYTGIPQEKTLPKWVPPDLADRIGLERPMLLPPLRSDEAMQFVRDLLAHFRLSEHYSLGEYFPFESEAIEELVKAIGRKNDLKPRSLMEALDASLRNLEPRIRSGEIKSIGLELLKESLAKLALDWEGGSGKRKGKA